MQICRLPHASTLSSTVAHSQGSQGFTSFTGTGGRVQQGAGRQWLRQSHGSGRMQGFDPGSLPQLKQGSGRIGAQSGICGRLPRDLNNGNDMQVSSLPHISG